VLTLAKFTRLIREGLQSKRATASLLIFHAEKIEFVVDLAQKKRLMLPMFHKRCVFGLQLQRRSKSPSLLNIRFSTTTNCCEQRQGTALLTGNSLSFSAVSQI
jgi:hypothetical protein